MKYKIGDKVTVAYKHCKSYRTYIVDKIYETDSPYYVHSPHCPGEPMYSVLDKSGICVYFHESRLVPEIITYMHNTRKNTVVTDT